MQALFYTGAFKEIPLASSSYGSALKIPSKSPLAFSLKPGRSRESRATGEKVGFWQQVEGKHSSWRWSTKQKSLLPFGTWDPSQVMLSQGT